MPDAVFPSRRDEAAAPAGSARFTFSAGFAGFLVENGRWAPLRGTPIERRDRAPSYSVISWILLVSSGFGGPLWRAIALVMSPWSLILPAMKACIAACGLASTIIALAVS
jgi:hypothetical protein